MCGTGTLASGSLFSHVAWGGGTPKILPRPGHVSGIPDLLSHLPRRSTPARYGCGGRPCPESEGALASDVPPRLLSVTLL